MIELNRVFSMLYGKTADLMEAWEALTFERGIFPGAIAIEPLFFAV